MPSHPQTLPRKPPKLPKTADFEVETGEVGLKGLSCQTALNIFLDQGYGDLSIGVGGSRAKSAET